MKRPRSTLITVMVLGTVVTLVGVTSILAAFSDRATTGTNSLTSAELARAVDLQIATRDGNGECGTFSDDLVTGLYDVVDIQPGFRQIQRMCVKNLGTLDASLQASAFDLLDVDVACTGDEAAAGDATCGGNAAGELSGYLNVISNSFDCSSGIGPGPIVLRLNQMTTTPADIGTVNANSMVCMQFEIEYVAGQSESLVAQTDRSTWRFALDGRSA